jgi:Zn-dependent peptidase ImmA (M78 family)
MSQTFIELAELAEHIAEENFGRKGGVNLEKIATKKKIRIIEEDYGDAFVGELVHENSKFYIHLNRTKYEVPGRRRFTIAHEYGHYFNDDHRNKLKQGISLAHTADYNMFSNNPIEKQANHFASNLLMPRERFIKKCNKLEPGFESVLSSKELFNTSIECTAIRYISLDFLPCMFIKWNPDFSCKYASYTKSLSLLVGLKGRPIIKADRVYLSELYIEYENEFKTKSFIEEATKLSNWVGTIPPDSKQDLIGLEQTIKTGDYGGITFLIFKQ